MIGFGPYAVAIAFWAFVLGVVITGVVADYKKRRVAMDVVRVAIERSQELTPELVEKLVGHTGGHEPVRPENLMIGGVIVLAAGVGFAILGGVFSQMGPAAWAMWPILGGAAIVLCVGIGLVIAARLVSRQQERSSERSP